MSELITIVKNQQVQSSKEQNKGGNSRYNGQDKLKNNEKGGGNLRGPDINSSGPFRNEAPPIQCYNCGGWGHKAFECPSPLNYRRGRLPRRKREQKLPQAKLPTCRAGQVQPNHKYKSELTEPFMIIIITLIQ